MESGITREQITYLEGYKYAGADNSLSLRFFLKPFIYDPLVNYVFPRKLAPNVITVLGVLAVSLVYLVSVFVHPNFGDSDGTTDPGALPWFSLLGGIALFIYQTADNTDGAHARNISCCSQIGDFLDHAGDQMAFLLTTLGLASVYQLGGTLWSAAMMMSILWAGFTSQWETLHREKLILWYLNGCMEGLLMGMGFYMLGAFFPGLMSSPVPIPDVIAHLIPFGLGNITYGQASAMIATSGGVSLGPSYCLWTVLTDIGPRAYLSAITQFIPYVVANVLIIVLYFVDRELCATYPHAWLALYGFVIIYIVQNLVLRRLLGPTRPFTIIQPITVLGIIPVVLGAVNSYLRPIELEIRRNVAVAAAIVATVLFIWRFLLSAQQLADGLKKPLWTTMLKKKAE